MPTSIPEATEVSSEQDVATRVGTVTLEITAENSESDINNSNLVQEALPTSYVEGSRFVAQRYSLAYANKVIDKSIVLAAFNSCIICGFGCIYTFLAVFYIALYFHIMLIFGIQSNNEITRQSVYKRNFKKKFGIFLVLSSYISKSTWVGTKILHRQTDPVFIVLGTLSFFHDIQLVYLMNESLISSQ